MNLSIATSTSELLFLFFPHHSCFDSSRFNQNYFSFLIYLSNKMVHCTVWSSKVVTVVEAGEMDDDSDDDDGYDELGISDLFDILDDSDMEVLSDFLSIDLSDFSDMEVDYDFESENDTSSESSGDVLLQELISQEEESTQVFTVVNDIVNQVVLNEDDNLILSDIIDGEQPVTNEELEASIESLDNYRKYLVKKFKDDNLWILILNIILIIFIIVFIICQKGPFKGHLNTHS